MRVSREVASELGAVILAGGRGVRLPDKCFRTLRGKELIVHVFEKIYVITREIVVAVKSGEQSNRVQRLLREARIVLDETDEEAPLAGFLSGLRAIKSQYVFVAPCDTPFIQPQVIRLLFQHAVELDGAFVVKGEGTLEPLCAVYHRDRAIRAAEDSIKARRMSMHDMLQGLEKLVRVPVDEIRKFDPELLTFWNINTPEELARAEGTV